MDRFQSKGEIEIDKDKDKETVRERQRERERMSQSYEQKNHRRGDRCLESTDGQTDKVNR